MKSTPLSLIVARTKNGVIGRENGLPFRLKEDMRHFVSRTMGKNVIMGRKTFQSIVAALGKPLPGRESYVLTRDLSFSYPGVFVFHDLNQLRQEIGSQVEREWVVIGGEEIYRQFLPWVEKIYLTQVDVELEGDAFFPTLNENIWETLNVQHYSKNAGNEYDFKILELQRKKGKN